MPAKPYKNRIDENLGRLKNDPDVRDPNPWFDRDSSPRGVGDIFLMVADFIDDCPKKRPIAKAFKKANLEPYNPIHWQYLLEAFADVHFGKLKPGRPPTRDNRQLLLDLRSLPARPGISKKELGDLLVETYPERYTKLANAKQMRTRLRLVRVNEETGAVSLAKERPARKSPTQYRRSTRI